jgi:hypothetical protein
MNHPTTIAQDILALLEEQDDPQAPPDFDEALEAFMHAQGLVWCSGAWVDLDQDGAQTLAHIAQENNL